MVEIPTPKEPDAPVPARVALLYAGKDLESFDRDSFWLMGWLLGRRLYAASFAPFFEGLEAFCRASEKLRHQPYPRSWNSAAIKKFIDKAQEEINGSN